MTGERLGRSCMAPAVRPLLRPPRPGLCPCPPSREGGGASPPARCLRAGPRARSPEGEVSVPAPLRLEIAERAVCTSGSAPSSSCYLWRGKELLLCPVCPSSGGVCADAPSLVPPLPPPCVVPCISCLESRWERAGGDRPAPNTCPGWKADL